jgi:hypothetical protein
VLENAFSLFLACESVVLTSIMRIRLGFCKRSFFWPSGKLFSSMTYGALPPNETTASSRPSSLRRNAGLLLVAALGVCALAGVMVSSSQKDATVLLTAIVPGTQLELQTSQGPMSLTVDSPMNAAGYVHAHGMYFAVTILTFPMIVRMKTALVISHVACTHKRQQKASKTSALPYDNTKAHVGCRLQEWCRVRWLRQAHGNQHSSTDCHASIA